MTNEEMQKTIEFILEQQAQFVTRVQRDEERLTRLEDAFTTLVNIARITDERLDVFESGISRLTEKMTTLAEAQARADDRIAELAEAQAHSDQRLNALIDVVERYINRGGNGGPTS
jgi:chromosome segregation ATPase